MPFSNLSIQAHSFLTYRAEAVKNAEPDEIHTLSFRTSDLLLGVEPAAIFDSLTRWHALATRWIYIFDTPASPPERKAMVQAFTKARDAKVPRFRYARLNDELGGSTVLYVGSSESLKSRIRNHLGYLVGPYSLNMAHWRGMPDVEIRLHAARYAEMLSKEVLCDLEDTLSLSLSPIFGKRGSV